MTKELLILFIVGLLLTGAAYLLREKQTWRNVLAVLGVACLLIPLILIIYFLVIIFSA